MIAVRSSIQKWGRKQSVDVCNFMSFHFISFFFSSRTVPFYILFSRTAPSEYLGGAHSISAEVPSQINVQTDNNGVSKFGCVHMKSEISILHLIALFGGPDSASIFWLKKTERAEQLWAGRSDVPATAVAATMWRIVTKIKIHSVQLLTAYILQIHNLDSLTATIESFLHKVHKYRILFDHPAHFIQFRIKS